MKNTNYNPKEYVRLRNVMNRLHKESKKRKFTEIEIENLRLIEKTIQHMSLIFKKLSYYKNKYS